ncbi:MAG: hypothetical protein PHC54_05565 [Candidatus Omnitrophica bacterium]|nr:hypothetical protein [Candidatus Omnitrophota bacterium]MDD5592933.1 hypothetical protein [Candidatus Omnitrophota bacterium]
MMIKNFNVARQSVFLVLLVSGALLAIPAAVLSGRIALITKDTFKNQAILNQVMPGLNNQTLALLKEDKDQLLETQLLPLVYLFDPPQKEIKKDYDPAIYFVDQLDNINQALKNKAIGKKVNYKDLGFKEKLPEEKEARHLLKQLYVLQEVVNTGIDCGINFVSITPQPPEDLSGLSGVKAANARLELAAPASAFLEFVIQASQIVPLVSIDSMLLQSQGSDFKIEMVISQTLIEADWKDKGLPFSPLNLEDVFLGQERFINILRGNNAFSVPKPQEPAPAQVSAAGAEQPKQAPRFLYRGKATLKSAEVAVVEDTLNKKTVFLAPQGKIGDFMLKELKAQEIILKNTTNGQEITIKREAK